MNFEPHNLRVVFIPEGRWWVGVCLEYFIAPQSKTLEGAKLALIRTLTANALLSIEHKEPPFSNKSPAPPEYVEMWKTGRESFYLHLYAIDGMPGPLRILGEYRARLMN